MKKYASLLLLIVFLLGACKDIFSPIPIIAPGNNGNGKVFINLENNKARTILPSQYDLSVLYFKLIFTDQGTSNDTVEALDKNTFFEKELPEGTYNLTVYGYEDKNAADLDTVNTGAGALFTGEADENPFTVSKAGNTNLSVVMEPNTGILKQTAGRNGTLSYEITIPQGANGALTVEGNDPVNLNETTNKGSMYLPSGDYEVIILINYDNKVKVVREIAQLYDHTTSVANFKFEPEDFINAASVAISDISIDGKIGSIIVVDSTITVMVHPDMKGSLNALTPKISFSGAMIQPVGSQDFSDEKTVAYTVFSESGDSAVFNIVVKIATVDFTTAPGLTVDGKILSADYTITKPAPDADTLTFYYAKGNLADAAAVISAADVVLPITNDTALSGTALGLDNDQLYSFVVEAIKEHYNPASSAVRRVTPSSKKQLAEEDFDWSGSVVDFTGSPLPVTINAKPDNGASLEISSGQITILYTGIAPTVYSSTDAPTDAGTYAISVSVAATASFADATDLPLDGDYEIEPIVPVSVIWPSGLTATYGQTLTNISLAAFTNAAGSTPGEFEWDVPSTSVGTAAGSPHSFAMTFYPASANYLNAKKADVSVTVNPAVPVASDFTFNMGSHTYDGSDKPALISPLSGKTDGTITISYNGLSTLPRAAGSYAVTFNVAASSDGNWAAASGLSAGTLEIGKANLTAADFSVSGNTHTFDNSAKTASVALNITRFNSDPGANAGLTQDVYYGEGTDTAQTNAGTYPIYIDVTAATNFNVTATPLEHSAVLTINLGTFTVPPVLTSLTPGIFNGELDYAFSAADPAAGTSYTLYYATGSSFATAQDLVNAADGNISASAGTGTISSLADSTTYSVVILAQNANYNDVFSGILNASTLIAFTTGISDLDVTHGPSIGILNYTFSATDPAADTYTLYYIEGEFNDAGQIIAGGTAVANAVSPGTITGLNNDTFYSIVVVANKAGYAGEISNIVKGTTGIDINVSIQESDLNTVVSWSFENSLGTPFPPASSITLTYNYSGLAIVGGKLTNTPISGPETKTFGSSVRQDSVAYIAHGGLVTVTDIVVSLFGGSVQSTPQNASPLELRLYNVAYSKASEYGALEMLSHGRASPDTNVPIIGPSDIVVAARGNMIINYQNGVPVELYSTTFSRGQAGGGLASTAANPATQLREWYYDGAWLYGRSNGGNTNIVDGNDAFNGSSQGSVIPNATADRWANRNSVDVAGTQWNNVVTAFAQDPYNYIPYNINAAYTSLYQYWYPNPQTTRRDSNMADGRADAPFGLIQTSTRGALADNGNGTFQFSILMDGNVTGNKANIEWSGDVSITNMGHSSITFVFDEDMKFVKYHVMERYTVTTLSASTNTCTTMYFVYHDDNIDIGNYATYRPHQLRPDHVNYVGTGVNPESVIAPNGNVATGNMVIANSKYDITLGWTASANSASKIAIPWP